MKQTVRTVLLSSVIALAGLMGCQKETPAPVAGPGGVIPGERAAKRAIKRVFHLTRMEKRDRLFDMIDSAYEPILKSLQSLDPSREQLINVLKVSAHRDLALMLENKTLTNVPGLTKIIMGPAKEKDFQFDGKTALLKLEIPMPSGKKKTVSTKVVRDDVSWTVNLPLTEDPDAKADPAVVDEIKADTDKIVAALKKVMDGYSERLKAGEMIETQEIREKLDEAGRPLVAVMQRIIYGETNIKG